MRHLWQRQPEQALLHAHLRTDRSTQRRQPGIQNFSMYLFRGSYSYMASAPQLCYIALPAHLQAVLLLVGTGLCPEQPLLQLSTCSCGSALLFPMLLMRDRLCDG